VSGYDSALEEVTKRRSKRRSTRSGDNEAINTGEVKRSKWIGEILAESV
jgi:hypothetical protein